MTNKLDAVRVLALLAGAGFYIYGSWAHPTAALSAAIGLVLIWAVWE